MKMTFKYLLLTAFLLIVLVAAFAIYRNSYPYLADGAVDAERIALIAANEKNLTVCGKIKNSIFFLNGFDITREEIKSLCYYKQAEFMKDKNVCDLVKPYSPDTKEFSYADSCKKT